MYSLISRRSLAAFILGASLFLGIHSAAAFTFESLKTDHGLTVWLMPQSHAKTIKIIIHNPVGSSYDPHGKEGLAHLVEHMLFTNNVGKSELEFMKDLESKGGAANGYTDRNETVYTLTAPSEESKVAMDWIRKLLFNHRFKPEGLSKERNIVILESDLTPREPLDYVKRFYDLLDFFDQPDFWEEEFGIDEDDRKIGGSYESVQKITLEDVQSFYDTYYRSNHVRVFVVGDFDPKEVREEIQKNFYFAQDLQAEKPADLEEDEESQFRPLDPVRVKLKNPERYRQIVHFVPAGSLPYGNSFKVYDATQDDALTLFFLKDFLREWLNDELRFKERLTYGVSTNVTIRKNAAYFEIDSDFAVDHYEQGRDQIEKVLNDLKEKRFNPELFEEYRKRAQVQIKLQTRTPEAASNNFESAYANAAIFDSYPDRLAFYQGIDQDKISAFLGKWLVHNNQIIEISRQPPLSRTTQLVLLLVFLVGVFVLLRRHWMTPIDLMQIHYIRKIHYTLFQWLLFYAFLATGYTFYQFFIHYLFERFRHIYIAYESFWIHLASQWTFAALWVFLSLLPFTLFPRKILLFSDYVLLKFWSYRSWKIPYETIRTVRLAKFSKVFFSKKGLLTLPLTGPHLKRSIFLKAKSGWGLYFQTHNNREFVEVFRQLSRIRKARKTFGEPHSED